MPLNRFYENIYTKHGQFALQNDGKIRVKKT